MKILFKDESYQNYLKATGMSFDLLVNFGHYLKLEYQRIVK